MPALLDQPAGARQLLWITPQQAAQLALEGDGAILALPLCAGFAVEAHGGGKIVGGGGLLLQHAEGRQRVDGFGGAAQARQFALQFLGQRRIAAFHQPRAQVRQARQVQAGPQQRGAVFQRCVRLRGIGIGGQLFQHPGQVAFGLQQQALRIAGQLAGAEQFAGGETAQRFETVAEGAGQAGGQLRQLAAQPVDGLLGGSQAQGVAAGEVVADVARHLVVEAARQFQVTVEHGERSLHGLLRPPQGGAEGEADDEQEGGIQVGQQFEAHGRSRPTALRRARGYCRSVTER
ncbi:hypothetical protein D3C76_1028490 [compost metagenome]